MHPSTTSRLSHQLHDELPCIRQEAAPTALDGTAISSSAFLTVRMKAKPYIEISFLCATNPKGQ